MGSEVKLIRGIFKKMKLICGKTEALGYYLTISKKLVFLDFSKEYQKVDRDAKKPSALQLIFLFLLLNFEPPVNHIRRHVCSKLVRMTNKYELNHQNYFTISYKTCQP